MPVTMCRVRVRTTWRNREPAEWINDLGCSDTRDAHELGEYWLTQEVDRLAVATSGNIRLTFSATECYDFHTEESE